MTQHGESFSRKHLCRTYGFDSSGDLGGGQVRIGKRASQAKEAEEAEQKVDPHGVTRDTFFALHERSPALIG